MSKSDSTDQRGYSTTTAPPPTEQGMPHDCGEVHIPGQRFESCAYVWERTDRRLGAFTLVTDDGVASVHSGRDVTLDRVIGYEAYDEPPRGMNSPEDGMDYAVFDTTRDSGRIVAIIRRVCGRPDEVIRIDPVAPIVPGGADR